MKLSRTYKYRINPGSQFIAYMEEVFETHRHLYNESLSWRIHAYDVYGKSGSISFFDQNRWMAAEKKRNPYLQRVCGDSLSLTLKRLDRAFQAFFSRLKRNKKPGFPRFKAKGSFNSVTFTVRSDRKQKAEKINCKGAFVLSPSGSSKGLVSISVIHPGKRSAECVSSPVVWHRDLPEGYVAKQVHVSREGKRWFICISLQMDSPAPSCGDGVVGIDVGLTSFVTTSEGKFLGSSKELENSLRKLRTAQRHLSRCKKGSKRWGAARDRVAAIYSKVKNSRKHGHFEVANAILDGHRVVGVEDLDVKGMLKNQYLARRISDASWASFRLRLASVAEMRGGEIVAVNPRNTSQRCSGCGEIVKKELSDRVHDCPHCGLVIDRDVNAARNIAALAQQKTGGGHPADANVEGVPHALSANLR